MAGNYERIGIPLNMVGKRLKQLNEAVKGNNMLISDIGKIELSCSREDTALSVQITVFLFDDEKEEKKTDKS